MFLSNPRLFISILGLVLSAPAITGPMYHQPDYSGFSQTYGPSGSNFKRLNVYTNAGPYGFRVNIIASGYKSDELDIQIFGGRLKISAGGQSSSIQQGAAQFKSWGVMSRTVWLPRNVDMERMQTRSNRGGRLQILFPWRR